MSLLTPFTCPCYHTLLISAQSSDIQSKASLHAQTRHDLELSTLGKAMSCTFADDTWWYATLCCVCGQCFCLKGLSMWMLGFLAFHTLKHLYQRYGILGTICFFWQEVLVCYPSTFLYKTVCCSLECFLPIHVLKVGRQPLNLKGSPVNIAGSGVGRRWCL